MPGKAQLAITQLDGSKIYLWTRFLGNHLPAIVQSTLKRSTVPWRDHAMLASLLHDEMTQYQPSSILTMGISTLPQDGAHYPTIILDTFRQVAMTRGEDATGMDQEPWASRCGRTRSFAQICDDRRVSWAMFDPLPSERIMDAA